MFPRKARDSYKRKHHESKPGYQNKRLKSTDSRGRNVPERDDGKKKKKNAPLTEMDLILRRKLKKKKQLMKKSGKKKKGVHNTIRTRKRKQ